jgi:hypothetical protein
VKATNNLRQIGIAMHNYHDVYRGLPPRAIFDDDGKPLLSWRVAILPYIEQQDLYEQFHLDEPWDSEHNKKLIARMPEVYANPTLFGRSVAKGDDPADARDPADDDEALYAKFKTRYMVPLGDETLFQNDEDEQGLGFAAVVDGLSNTVMVMEAPEEKAVIWSKPEDWEVDLDEPAEGLFPEGERRLNVLMGDASVRALRSGIADEVLKALFTRAGGEVVDYEAFDGPATGADFGPRDVPVPAVGPRPTGSRAPAPAPAPPRLPR